MDVVTELTPLLQLYVNGAVPPDTEISATPSDDPLQETLIAAAEAIVIPPVVPTLALIVLVHPCRSLIVTV